MGAQRVSREIREASRHRQPARRRSLDRNQNVIALSQGNPLEAVAELAENSIDARAKTIVIVRGEEKGRHHLQAIDDAKATARTPTAGPISTAPSMPRAAGWDS